MTDLDRFHLAVRGYIKAWMAVGGLGAPEDLRCITPLVEGDLILRVCPMCEGTCLLHATVRSKVMRVELPPGYDPGRTLRKVLGDLLAWRRDPHHIFRNYDAWSGRDGKIVLRPRS